MQKGQGGWAHRRLQTLLTQAVASFLSPEPFRLRLLLPGGLGPPTTSFLPLPGGSTDRSTALWVRPSPPLSLPSPSLPLPSLPLPSPPLLSLVPWPALSALGPQVLPGLGGLPPGPSAAEERDGSEWPTCLTRYPPQGKARALWGLTLQVLKGPSGTALPWDRELRGAQCLDAWWEAQLQP